MVFKPFDVSAPHIAYACLGGFVVLFGMFSLFIREKLYVGEACVAFVFGVIIGPYVLNLFDPRDWAKGNNDVINDITLEVTRFVLAIGVFAIGVELPKAYMARHWKSIAFLLIPVMTWGWFASAALIFVFIPVLDFRSSLAIAACLTPTDPILAAAVVGGKYADKHVPAHLRHLLAAESGCNDGAAFPFLFIALYLVLDNSTKHAVQDWFLITWLYEIILGIVIGSLLGYSFRHLMKFCERKDLIDRQSYVAQYVSLAMLTIGVCTLLGSDDLLAAFASGTAFAWDGFFNRQTEQAVFSAVIDLLFNIATFIFIGAWMPFNEFSNATLTITPWRLVVIAVLVLLLRRLPVMIALYKFIPDVETLREAFFSGHFGPIGVGAVFISTLAAKQLPPVPESGPEDQVEYLAASIQSIVAFMVLCSIAVHGLSIPFFSLGRRVRTVSRTWSRHPSLDPEWTTHTRRVVRGDEIVINRDPLNAMERGVKTGEKAVVFDGDVTEKNSLEDGEGAPVKGKVERDSVVNPRAIPTELDGDADGEVGVDGDFGADESDTKAETTTAGSKTPVMETPGSSSSRMPSAADVMPPQAQGRLVENVPRERQGEGEAASRSSPEIMEWKEGDDIVVERRNGPGEEVEVEVIKCSPSAPAEQQRRSNVFRGSPESVRHEAQAHIESLTLQGKQVGENIRNTVEGALGSVGLVANTVSRAMSPTTRTQERASRSRTQSSSSDEWSDDPGNAVQERDFAHRSGSGSSKRRSRSLRTKFRGGAAGGGNPKTRPSGRRRDSINQGRRSNSPGPASSATPRARAPSPPRVEISQSEQPAPFRRTDSQSSVLALANSSSQPARIIVRPPASGTTTPTSSSNVPTLARPTPLPTPRGSTLQLRIVDELREDGTRRSRLREASPARSIRFADQAPAHHERNNSTHSTPGTPKLGTSPSPSAHPHESSK